VFDQGNLLVVFNFRDTNYVRRRENVILTQAWAKYNP
jgi:hypothetical protein